MPRGAPKGHEVYLQDVDYGLRGQVVLQTGGELLQGANDFASVLDRVREGSEVIIEHYRRPVCRCAPGRISLTGVFSPSPSL